MLYGDRTYIFIQKKDEKNYMDEGTSSEIVGMHSVVDFDVCLQLLD